MCCLSVCVYFVGSCLFFVLFVFVSFDDFFVFFFFFQAEDGIRDHCVTGVQTCALPISPPAGARWRAAAPPSATCERRGRRRGATAGSGWCSRAVSRPERATQPCTVVPFFPLSRPRRGRVLGHGQDTKRSEEHTSELQSHSELVCRLLLEEK